MRFEIMKRYAICIVASVIVSIGVVLGGSCGLAYAAVTSDQLWVEPVSYTHLEHGHKPGTHHN